MLKYSGVLIAEFFSNISYKNSKSKLLKICFMIVTLVLLIMLLSRNSWGADNKIDNTLSNSTKGYILKVVNKEEDKNINLDSTPEDSVIDDINESVKEEALDKLEESNDEDLASKLKKNSDKEVNNNLNDSVDNTIAEEDSWNLFENYQNETENNNTTDENNQEQDELLVEDSAEGIIDINDETIDSETINNVAEVSEEEANDIDNYIAEEDSNNSFDEVNQNEVFQDENIDEDTYTIEEENNIDAIANEDSYVVDEANQNEVNYEYQNTQDEVSSYNYGGLSNGAIDIAKEEIIDNSNDNSFKQNVISQEIANNDASSDTKNEGIGNNNGEKETVIPDHFYQYRNELNLKNIAKIIDKNESIDAYKEIAWVYFNQKRYKDAFVNFDKAISLDKEDYNLYNGRGSVYYVKKQYDMALEDFARAVAIDNSKWQAYANMGLAYYEMKDLDQAERNLKKALSINNDNQQVNYYYNMVLSAKKNKNKKNR